MSKSVKITSDFANSFRRRTTCNCASLSSTRTLLPHLVRNLTTSSARRDEEERYGNRGRELRTGPRWLSTPPRMMAPVRSKPPVADNDFVVNEDPERLDRVYDLVLGKGGCQMLTDEVKWLAVTHKSFDHGRRGFNDRLSYLGTKLKCVPTGIADEMRLAGRRWIDLQTVLTLLHRSSAAPLPEAQDQYGREPFRHPALDGLAGLRLESKSQVLNHRSFARLAVNYKLDTVMRWKPRRVRSRSLSCSLMRTERS